MVRIILAVVLFAGFSPGSGCEDEFLDKVSKQIDKRNSGYRTFAIQYIREREILDPHRQVPEKDAEYFECPRPVTIVADGKNLFFQYTDPNGYRPTVIFNEAANCVTITTLGKDGRSMSVGFRRPADLIRMQNTFVEPFFLRAFGVAYPRRLAEVLNQELNPIRNMRAKGYAVSAPAKGDQLIFRGEHDRVIVQIDQRRDCVFVSQQEETPDGRIKKKIESFEFRQEGSSGVSVPRKVVAYDYIHWKDGSLHSKPVFKQTYSLIGFTNDVDADVFNRDFRSPGVEVLDTRSGNRIQYTMPVAIEQIDEVVSEMKNSGVYHRRLTSGQFISIGAICVFCLLVAVAVWDRKRKRHSSGGVPNGRDIAGS